MIYKRKIDERSKGHQVQRIWMAELIKRGHCIRRKFCIDYRLRGYNKNWEM